MPRRCHGGRFGAGESLAVAISVIAIAPAAAAHISLEEGGTHRSRYGDGELKAGPCGKAGGTRGTNVYTYAPGQKITVSVVESIPHPGYFRLAFDDDGDNAFIEPASIKPIDPSRKCPNGPTDRCGTSDFYNSPAVLPGMDNLNPHLTAALGTKYTWEVALPDVECSSCTLQVIQVMEDDLTHGPYDPTPGVGVADIYHQCVDIVLKRPADAGTGGPNDAGASNDVRTPPTSDAGSSDTGAGGGTGGSGAGGSGAGGSSAGGSGGAAGAGARAGSGGSGASPPDDGEGGCSIAGPRAAGKAHRAIAWSLVALALTWRRRRRT